MRIKAICENCDKDSTKTDMNFHFRNNEILCSECYHEIYECNRCGFQGLDCLRFLIEEKDE